MVHPRRSAVPAHRIAGRSLRIALQRRCPACGRGSIWQSWFTLRPACPVCGLVPHRGEPDYFIGAYFVNFIVAELVPVIVFVVGMVATWPTPPWNALLYLAAALAVVAPIVLYPFTATFWLAIDMAFRPPGRER